MELLSLHLLHPRTGHPSLPLAATAAAAPSNTRRPQSRTCLLAPRHRRRAARLSVSAVAADKPLAEEVPPL
jgi:hypothetical protein